mgnify:CR=1 FL=1
MFIEDRAQALRGLLDGLIDTQAYRVALTLIAQKCLLHAPRFAQWLMAGQPLGAQPAGIAGVLLVAADLGHLVACHRHDDAAPDPAIGTNAAYRGAGHAHLLKTKTKRRPAAPGLKNKRGSTAPLS